jgi:hypothetical protein
MCAMWRYVVEISSTEIAPQRVAIFDFVSPYVDTRKFGWDAMKKPFPKFHSDEQLEAFLKGLNSEKEIRGFEFGFPSAGFGFPSSEFGFPFLMDLDSVPPDLAFLPGL